ncbi:2-hydroxychromene-2-carboxylate isomerase [Leptothrix discophora]|uniref:2-hydroxychromene-2-carboxylate isomerase n=1 Tax=Leptothrix discophora TaxID=89 RepID=A0ABT9G5M6_LEPDI|nr:2-hydroxychromene-2-carboxylate isomerase [Leptothrix discophora]MDP4301798.1 2-hydroxychromene-2-carboxylate isomerase [Leptothrix discophora]
MNAPAPIEFYFDFSSPYAYIASEWIEALAARHGRPVRWHAILLGVTFQAAELKSPVSYPIKREYALRDFARSARMEGVPFAMPTPFPIATHNAARLFWWLESQDPQRAVAWARSGLRGFFARGVNLNDMAALQGLAAESGIAPEQCAAVCADPAWKDRLRRENESAIAAGVFGAPYFIVDGEPFWGNDRKQQIDRWLSGDR